MGKKAGFRPQAQNPAAVTLQAKFNQAVALHQQGKLAKAERVYEEVLRQQPNHFDALHLLGVIALHTRRTERAVELIRRAIGLNAKIAAAHSNLGNGLRDLKRPAEALASYDKAIALKPDYAEAYSNRGNALLDLKRLEDAEASYDRAIALKPDYAQAYHNRGKVLLDLRRPADALMCYDKAIALRSDYTEAYYSRGVVLMDLKRPEDALASYDKAVAIKPDYAEAYNNRGNALTDLKRPEEALASYDKAIALRPDYAEAYYSRGVAQRDLKHVDEAVASYDKAIAIKPDYAEAYNNRGNALTDLKRPKEALASYDKAIALKPDYAEAYSNRGNALQDLKRPADALESYDKANAFKPAFAEAYSSRGNALIELKRPEDALANCDKAIALKPDFAEAYYNRGNALQDLRRSENALASYDKAIALKPDFAEAYSNRGNALQDLKRPADALASYDRAIALKPDLAEAYNNRGNALQDLKCPEDALVSYEQAIALKPDYAEAHSNRGNALRDLQRAADALASYDQAIALKSNFAEAYSSRGNALIELKRPEDALTSYDRAIALKPDFAEAYYNRGNALRDQERLADALTSYNRAIALNPDLAELEGVRLYTKMHLCDWSNYDSECAHLISSVQDEKLNTPPFPFFAITSTPNDQLKCAKLWIASQCPPSEKPTWQGERYDHDRVRVAYLSADFHGHTTSYLMAGLFECHDKSNFNVTAISLGPDDNSEMRQRLKASFEHFIDVKTYSDSQIANLVKELEIDILIDLKGFTKNSRRHIFARRPAPIQINYHGTPGTMGAEYMDYIIADRIVIPENQYASYAEKIVVLPNSYQVNDNKRPIADRTFTRIKLGLPPAGFVFCCFNNNYKITPRVFDCWMRILKQVGDSVLWLLEENVTASAKLRKEAQARGVDAERLIFAKHMSVADHLARRRLADLFLDTLPCNAHTTASDPLWVGVPVLTCQGETFVGRVVASVLNAIRLPELVTTTLEEYERLAIELATNPEKLARIKRKLADNRLTTTLFDTKLFTKHIEAAYTAMFERHKASLAPDHIIIPN